MYVYLDIFQIFILFISQIQWMSNICNLMHKLTSLDLLKNNQCHFQISVFTYYTHAHIQIYECKWEMTCRAKSIHLSIVGREGSPNKVYIQNKTKTIELLPTARAGIRTVLNTFPLSNCRRRSNSYPFWKVNFLL